MKKVFKLIVKTVGIIMALVALGGIAAGVVDRLEQIKSGRVMHGVYDAYIKRPLDFMLSALVFIFLWPVYAVLYVLVAVKLGTPVLFTQDRPGRDEKVFRLYKFRSMTDERDENGRLLPDDVRLTDFGKKLRATSLDELPELFNILKGDMSLIGPRPLLVEYLPWYTEEEKHRHDVRPGLTGLAQVNGRNNLEWDSRLHMDVEYAKNISFVSDMNIILKTIQKVTNKSDITVDTTKTEGNLARIRREKAEAAEQ